VVVWTTNYRSFDKRLEMNFDSMSAGGSTPDFCCSAHRSSRVALFPSVSIFSQKRTPQGEFTIAIFRKDA